MNYNLEKNNYIIIPNFISKERASEIGKEFKAHCENVSPGGDDSVPTSECVYNFLPILELMCEKTHQISSILEEPVLPTYCYSRLYKNGNILHKHTDRDACEISLTVHLCGDKPWKIWIETPEGDSKSVSLEPGDAMMYFGITAPHWRDEYNGEYYCQSFIHYVRSRGDKLYTYFDKCRGVKEECDLYNMNSIPKPNIEKKPIELPDSQKLVIPKSSNTLEQYIHVFDNILSDELCDMILNEYKKCDEWSDSQIGSEITPVNKDIRNCQQISISCEEIKEKNPEIREKIDKLLFESISKAVGSYSNNHPDFTIDIDTGYQLLKYDVGGFYTKHVDSFKKEQRSVSCSLALNDDYEGGEFSFFSGDVLIKSRKGSAVMFPSNFMYPHEILPISKGTRYSIITWMV